MSCGNGGSTRWFYTGNQVGLLNFVGLYNFVAGGPTGSGISAGFLVPVFFPPPVSRELWKNSDSKFNQELLDGCFPFIELNWIADIFLGDEVFRVSDRNIYVEEEDGTPRFYEARVAKGPSIQITTGEWLAPNFEIGDMRLALNNRDGFFNAFLAQGEQYTQWTSAKVQIRVGYGEKFEHYFVLFNGFVAAKQGVTATETDITLKCYDQFDRDEVPIPPSMFNEINFPDIQEGVNGKPVPLIYGDWTVEAGPFGEIPAYCLNAQESDASFYIFKISQNALVSITDIYLHRGDRTAERPDGPIKLDGTYITKDPARGEFAIPAQIPVLTDYSVVMDRTTAGTGSGVNLITSESASSDFILKGVKAGDLVFKTKTSEQATVLAVASNQLILSGGLGFAQGDEYGIRTKNYTFKRGDKFTLKCLGKKINVISVNRLADAGLGASIPTGLTIGIDGTYWFADNNVKKIYQVDLHDVVKKEIPYSDIDPSIVEVSGLSIQTDKTLWLFEKPSSTIYRFLLDTDTTGLVLPTTDVVGLGISLSAGTGLTIDTGNLLYVVDNATGNFYVINPFTIPAPTLAYSWTNSAFDPAAQETLDLSVDVNLLQLVVADRQTQKFYRIDPTNGILISEAPLGNVGPDVNFVTGITVHQDGTIFFLNRSDMSLYNYNEDPNAMHNPGFIARDLIQSMAGKVATDFDLSWNETARSDLSQYFSRLYIDEKTSVVTFVNKFLQQFNTAMSIRFEKYALFYIHFDNFRTDGKIIREGDLKENSFQAAKEYNQYFNSAFGDYAKLPFSNKAKRSDTYLSPSGVAMAEKEVTRKIDLPNVYRREDVDKLYPLFVRLSAAEPEFLSLDVSWRQIFTQISQFFQLNYYEEHNCVTGKVVGGRRFKDVPTFVRSITFNLDTMSVKLKLWSLGTTAFGSYVPVGPVAGGEDDRIVLTNLGSLGYISPIGIITGSGANSITLEDSDGQNAENRQAPVVGNAWQEGFVVAIIDAVTQQVVEHAVIDSVIGQVITFENPLTNSVQNTMVNAASFISGGYYLRYANYDQTSLAQKRNFSHFCPPIIGYPTSGAQEVEEQRSGLHNLSDDRVPYILFPKDYTAS